MNDLSHYAFVAALAAIALAFTMHLSSVLNSGLHFAFSGSLASGGTNAKPRRQESSGRYASVLLINAFIFLTAALLLRTAVAGHAPFSNMFEFSMAFSWAAIGFAIYIELRYHLRAVTLFVVPVVVALLAYAATVPNAVEPLAPALQNEPLLTAHVAVAILAYGAFTVAFAAGVLYIVQRRNTVRWLPNNVLLDEIGYKAVMVGFPMLGLAIVMGAVWADIAWGSYWSWDPKETAALATWLIYGGYLHARVLRGWRGQRSALLLIGGFAATLLTYYGNLFLGGLHTYG